MESTPRVIGQVDNEGFANFIDMLLAIESRKLSVLLNKKVGAFVIFPGMGEPWRLDYPGKLMETFSIKAKYILVAGYNSSEVESFFKISEFEKNYSRFLSADKIFIEEPAEEKNTKTQALWVAGKIKELEIESLVLCLPPYHLVRAFLTLLKICQDKEIGKTLISPYVIPVSMNEIIPMPINQEFYKQIDLLGGEIKRIIIYQANGDVASYEAGTKHLVQLNEMPSC